MLERGLPLSREAWELDPVPTATGAAGPAEWTVEWARWESAPLWGDQLTRERPQQLEASGASPLLEAAGTSFGIRISRVQKEGWGPP